MVFSDFYKLGILLLKIMLNGFNADFQSLIV
jgi:hypothetical protein